jgi:hypothetical protein
LTYLERQKCYGPDKNINIISFVSKGYWYLEKDISML